MAEMTVDTKLCSEAKQGPGVPGPGESRDTVTCEVCEVCAGESLLLVFCTSDTK